MYSRIRNVQKINTLVLNKLAGNKNFPVYREEIQHSLSYLGQ
ncbi:hypothetical protein [uncultured Parabacteroides sp.]